MTLTKIVISRLAKEPDTFFRAAIARLTRSRSVRLTENEKLLLAAALNSDPTVASSSWDSWISNNIIEEAPHSELRLFPLIYANLDRVAPDLRLPKKLSGKAKATFTMNKVLAHGVFPTIEALSEQTPVILAKGLDFCIRFNAWPSRPMGDVDVYVPFKSLERAASLLDSLGWAPKYGLTLASLLHRTSLRRGSWNFTKGRLDLDLHWRLLAGEAEDWLDRMMWGSAERVDFLGRDYSVQSPEFAFVSSLRHGFVEGSRGDLLQSVVDAASWLPICREDKVARLLSNVGLSSHYRTLISILRDAGRFDIASGATLSRYSIKSIAPSRNAIAGSPRPEKAMLRHPMLYRLWKLLGQRSSAERLLLRLTGPFSKPLAYSPTFHESYDLRDCAIIDRIGGPGFSWPDPELSCFWSDRADARLLLPLTEIADHVLFLDIAEQWRDSTNASINVFANGAFVAGINMRESNHAPRYGIIIPKRCLRGPWVELSFRPSPYRPGQFSSNPQRLRRSIPFRTLHIYTEKMLTAEIGNLPGFYRSLPELHLLILGGKEPYASKYKRIQQKIETSSLRQAAGLPEGFDPISYVLYYRDLFEAEVDPYEHYMMYGKREGRAHR